MNSLSPMIRFISPCDVMTIRARFRECRECTSQVEIAFDFEKNCCKSMRMKCSGCQLHYLVRSDGVEIFEKSKCERPETTAFRERVDWHSGEAPSSLNVGVDDTPIEEESIEDILLVDVNEPSSSNTLMDVDDSDILEKELKNIKLEKFYSKEDESNTSDPQISIANVLLSSDSSDDEDLPGPSSREPRITKSSPVRTMLPRERAELWKALKGQGEKLRQGIPKNSAPITVVHERILEKDEDQKIKSEKPEEEETERSLISKEPMAAEIRINEVANNLPVVTDGQTHKVKVSKDFAEDEKEISEACASEEPTTEPQPSTSHPKETSRNTSTSEGVDKAALRWTSSENDTDSENVQKSRRRFASMSKRRNLNKNKERTVLSFKVKRSSSGEFEADDFLNINPGSLSVEQLERKRQQLEKRLAAWSSDESDSDDDASKETLPQEASETPTVSAVQPDPATEPLAQTLPQKELQNNLETVVADDNESESSAGYMDKALKVHEHFQNILSFGSEIQTTQKGLGSLGRSREGNESPLDVDPYSQVIDTHEEKISERVHAHYLDDISILKTMLRKMKTSKDHLEYIRGQFEYHEGEQARLSERLKTPDLHPEKRAFFENECRDHSAKANDFRAEWKKLSEEHLEAFNKGSEQTRTIMAYPCVDDAYFEIEKEIYAILLGKKLEESSSEDPDSDQGCSSAPQEQTKKAVQYATRPRKDQRAEKIQKDRSSLPRRKVSSREGSERNMIVLDEDDEVDEAIIDAVIDSVRSPAATNKDGTHLRSRKLFPHKKESIVIRPHPRRIQKIREERYWSSSSRSSRERIEERTSRDPSPEDQPSTSREESDPVFRCSRIMPAKKRKTKLQRLCRPTLIPEATLHFRSCRHQKEAWRFTGKIGGVCECGTLRFSETQFIVNKKFRDIHIPVILNQPVASLVDAYQKWEKDFLRQEERLVEKESKALYEDMVAGKERYLPNWHNHNRLYNPRLESLVHSQAVQMIHDRKGNQNEKETEQRRSESRSSSRSEHR